MTQYDYAVYIGRFQPYHAGHHHVALEALKIAKNLIFVIGSHDKPRDFRNPFTTRERSEIIRSAFFDTDINVTRLSFAPQVDYVYNEERWIASIQGSVSTIVHSKFNPDPIRICIIGYDKDHSSYYLKKFPQWDLIQIEPKFDLDATSIRNEIFGYTTSGLTTSPTYEFPGSINIDHRKTIIACAQEIVHQMNSEYHYIQKYRETWGKGPFVTVDAVVTQAGHILLIERGYEYGDGQWALPGGFINPDETLLQACLRELKEETKLKVPVPVLAGSIANQHTYDDPHRSNRARIISHAYHFKLNDMDTGLPKVKGADDAKRAFWVPMSEAACSRHKMFEDHFSIIEHMLGI